MWQLSSEENSRRVYTNSVTSSQCTTSMVYTDREGNKWWSFDDLMSLPYTRQFAATKISALYALGLSKDDLNAHITGLKAALRSTGKEKYEVAYALVLDFEAKANNATDAIKQMSSLVCVYFCLNDEPIDSFDNALQIKKMGLLEADVEAHSFFLNHQIKLIEGYTNHLKLISEIASLTTEEQLVHSE